MIFLFVNKQRHFSTDEVTGYQSICEKAMGAAIESSSLDKRLKKNGVTLSCSVSFVSKDYIKKKNAEFRDVNSTTDVLSFPLLDMKDGKLVSELSAGDLMTHKDGTIEILLGDVLICLEKAQEQAREYGHSMEREVAFLAAHAALHLIGYDHIEPEDEKKMISRQKWVLADLGYTRDAQRITPDTGSSHKHKPSDEEKQGGLASGSVEMLAHSGFCAIIGRPNVGKSTLLNNLSGMKLAIVSPKPQTTRKNTRSVITRNQSQVIFVDTPGIHSPKSKLAEYMVDAAFRAAKGADVILMLVDATKGRVSVVEKECCARAKEAGQKVILAINKADAVTKESLLPLISEYYSLYPFEAIIPISALTGDGVDELFEEIASHIPAGPKLFPEEDITDQSERALAAEFIREQILRFTNEEIPHGTAVDIEAFDERLKDDAVDEYDRDLVRINASIICEKESHRAILLGHKGQMIKRIGTSARISIEKMCGCKVYLDLHIKVRSDWKNMPSHLNNLGYKKEE